MTLAQRKTNYFDARARHDRGQAQTIIRLTEQVRAQLGRELTSTEFCGLLARSEKNIAQPKTEESAP